MRCSLLKYFLYDLKYFFIRYSKGYIFPIKSLKKAGMPIQPKSLKEFLEKSCEKFRHKLVKEYDIIFYFLLIINVMDRCA